MSGNTVEIDMNALAILKSNAEADVRNAIDYEDAERLTKAIEKADEALK